MTLATSLVETPTIGMEHCPYCDTPISRKQFLEIQSRIRDEEQQKLESQRRSLDEERSKLREQFRLKVEVANAEAQKRFKAEADAHVFTLTRDLTRERDEARTNMKGLQGQLKKQVADAEARVRDSMTKDAERKDLARAAEHAREREAWQRKLADLQRQLANKTANALGDDAEIDLYEMLRESCPDDKITRVAKGTAGADIKLEVRHKAVAVGAILFDSKNRKSWASSFASKLREDQVNANAAHAILSTTAFPAGKKELCIESDVIVARPGRVGELVQILRGEIIKAHVAGLTNQRRDEKREALYQFIVSEPYQQRAAEVTRLTDQLLDVDAKEKEQHDRTWKNRGGFLRQLQRAQAAIDTEVSAIVEGK